MQGLWQCARSKSKHPADARHRASGFDEAHENRDIYRGIGDSLSASTAGPRGHAALGPEYRGLPPAGCAGFGACGSKRVRVLALARCHLAHGQRSLFDGDLHVSAPLSGPRIAELARCWAVRGH
jgi:hypothetical protein